MFICSKRNKIIWSFNWKQLYQNGSKAELIKNWAVPTNTSELARFLGFTGYFRNFIDQYAAFTSTLTQLLHKDVEWYFGSSHITTFEFLKKCLVNYPILRLPDLPIIFIFKFILSYFNY